jgi:hypothetical protein
MLSHGAPGADARSFEAGPVCISKKDGPDSECGIFRAVKECPFLIQDVIEKEIKAFIGLRVENPQCELDETLFPQVVLRILLHDGIEVLPLPKYQPGLAMDVNNASRLGHHR